MRNASRHSTAGAVKTLRFANSVQNLRKNESLKEKPAGNRFGGAVHHLKILEA